MSQKKSLVLLGPKILLVAPSSDGIFKTLWCFHKTLLFLGLSYVIGWCGLLYLAATVSLLHLRFFLLHVVVMMLYLLLCSLPSSFKISEAHGSDHHFGKLNGVFVTLPMEPVDTLQVGGNDIC